jgi:hypothetical protein
VQVVPAEAGPDRAMAGQAQRHDLAAGSRRNSLFSMGSLATTHLRLAGGRTGGGMIRTSRRGHSETVSVQAGAGCYRAEPVT